MRRKIESLSTTFLSFLRSEASGGVILLICAILAVIIANSPWGGAYEHSLHTPIAIGIGPFSLEMGLLHWVNDGLMAVFFFLVGLEIKREFLYGELRTKSAMILPVCGALGGMLVPALFYSLLNFGTETSGGWGIPMATDIAFALGIMTLAARSAPPGLVVFLTALAIVDDLGAIVVIALFYSTDLAWIALASGLAALAGAFLLNRLKIRFFPAYLALGLVAWYFFLKAGIHPTIAGVILGFSIPAEGNCKVSMLHQWEKRLHPWSAYLIMPVFALSNAGVEISLASLDFTSPLPWGILAGLFLGKPVGIFGSVYLLHEIGHIDIPGKASPRELAATGMLGGIGFTMSIFIASIAFTDPGLLNLAKFSILMASTISAAAGTLVFLISGSKGRDTLPLSEMEKIQG
ncbi:Na+/H+ antiporter NhaA [Dialister succinatiphilus]|uniref:Na+/H+ antiporter NhaA n=1 Tax=Dialister succinatiphilus TaxID=487173 RepID=UPI002357C213|nr:Na+/H+ antiporter NhaA [Dialister succinatiphilus]